jgi:integrase
MRLSEALKLHLEDVDLGSGVLAIRQTKFSKDRYVPMTGEMTALCAEYLVETQDAYRPSNFFFSTPKGNRYDTSTVEAIFRELLFTANISH